MRLAVWERSWGCWGAILCLLALCACGSKPGGAQKKAAAVPPRSVQMATALMRPMERVVVANGTLAAQERSILSAKVSGRLQQLNVDIGSEVKKGDVLAQIEPRDYELGLLQARAALAQARTALGLEPEGESDQIQLVDVSSVKQAKAVLEEAEKNRRRVNQLSQSGIASQSEVDTVEAAYLVALTRYQVALEDARSRLATAAQRRAEFELANKRLADASLRAPFDGTVQARPAGLGEFVAAGTPTVELVKTDPLRLKLQVPERDTTVLRLGQVVRLSVEGDTNRYTGKITRISPALDEQTRMLLVEADVPKAGPLRPGLFVRGEIVVSTTDTGLSISSQCVMTFAGIEKVVLEENGKAVEKVINTGRRGPGWVEVTSGLRPGQKTIVNPEGLRTGYPVEVRPDSSTGTSSQETMPRGPTAG